MTVFILMVGHDHEGYGEPFGVYATHESALIDMKELEEKEHRKPRGAYFDIYEKEVEP